MSDIEAEEAVFAAYMRAHFPGVEVKAPAAPPAPAPATAPPPPAAPPAAAAPPAPQAPPTPTVSNGARQLTEAEDAAAFRQYMATHFPGVLPGP